MTNAIETIELDHDDASRPTVGDYFAVTASLVAFGVGLAVLVGRGAGAPARGEALVQPMLWLMGLTAVVWLVMTVVRNYSILRGLQSGRYYVDYSQAHPPDWVERPARTFNNLMQVPHIFYALSLILMITGHVDRAQVALAWVFVVVRACHAVIYMAWNHAPSRFGTWTAGSITLIVMGVRFALGWSG